MSDTFDVDKFLKMAECLPFATAQAGKPETQKAMREAAAEITRLRDELAACKAERNKAAWDGYNHGTEWAEEYQHCAFDKCMAARDKMTAKYGPQGQ